MLHRGSIRSVLLGTLLTAAASLGAPSTGVKTVPVTVDNFIRAESDLYMGRTVKEAASASSVTTGASRRSTSRP